MPYIGRVKTTENDMATEIIIGLVAAGAVVSAGFCTYLAKEKGRDPATWLMFGFLFGIVALLALVGLPALEKKPTTEEDEKENTPVVGVLVVVGILGLLTLAMLSMAPKTEASYVQDYSFSDTPFCKSLRSEILASTTPEGRAYRIKEYVRLGCDD